MSDFDVIRRVFEKSTTVKISDETVVIDGWIILTPIEEDEKIKTIAGTTTRKVTKWNIAIERVIFGRRYYPDGSGEPDDIEVEEVETGLSLENACKSVWHMIKDNEVDGILEEIYHEEIDRAEYEMERQEGI